MNRVAQTQATRKKELEKVTRMFEEVSQMFRNTMLRLQKPSESLDKLGQSMISGQGDVDMIRLPGISYHYAFQKLDPEIFHQRFMRFRELVVSHVIW